MLAKVCSQNPQLRGSTNDGDTESLGQEAKTGQGKGNFVLSHTFIQLRDGEAGDDRKVMFSEHITRAGCCGEQKYSEGPSRSPAYLKQQASLRI